MSSVATSENPARGGVPDSPGPLPRGRRRRGLGTEPMTCPPDAFRSGDGVIRLEPGQAVITTWGARLT